MLSPASPAVVLTAPDPRLRLSWKPGWRESVEAFVKDLALRGYSAYTIRDYRTDVMRLGAWLDVPPTALEPRHLKLADHLLEEEGFGLAARRRRLSAYTRFLEFTEARTPKDLVGPRLLAQARSLRPPDRLLLALVYFAGLRLLEVGHLEGRDVRFRRGVIVSRLGYRVVPLHPALVRLFGEVRDHLPIAAFRPLLPGLNGFALNARTLHCRFQRLARTLGFPGLRPDTLRRETSAFLMRQGAPPGLVRAFLGKDRGRPIAPRRGRLLDLTCLADRLSRLPE